MKDTFWYREFTVEELDELYANGLASQCDGDNYDFDGVQDEQ